MKKAINGVGENQVKIQNHVCTIGYAKFYHFQYIKDFWLYCPNLEIFLRKVKFENNQWDTANKYF